LRYQYLEELVADREKAVFSLREELEKVTNCMFISTWTRGMNFLECFQYAQWSKELAENNIPAGMDEFLVEMGMAQAGQIGSEALDVKPNI
jgi:hypothetical protein